MQDLNCVQLIGNLTRDPEVREGVGGGDKPWKVANLGIAVEGRTEGEVNFFDLALWGPTAEYAERNAQKGRRVAVTGRLQYRSWEKDDEKRSKVEIVVDEMWFLGPRKDGGEPPTAS